MADKVSLFEMGPARYQPDSSYTFSYDPSYSLDQRWLAFLVGLVALCLPIVMLIGRLLGTCSYDSISHFYYAQFLGGVFIAALVFVGTFLLAYRGESARESRLATMAGLCAISVALFPTNGRGCDREEFSGRALADFEGGGTKAFVTIKEIGKKITKDGSDLTENPFFQLFSDVQYIHGISAALLFAFLAWYSFFVFTRVIDKVHRDGNGKLTPQKRRRNGIYRASGIVIVVSMVAMVIGHFFLHLILPDFWDDNNLTFWFESLALWAFGISWMVKGQFVAALRDQ